MELFKKGCIGCSAFLAVLIMFAVASVGMAFLQAKDSTAETTAFAPELPASVSSGVGDSELGIENLEPAADGLAEAMPSNGVDGTLILDVAQCELIVEQAAPGEGLAVEASYEAGGATFTEEMSGGDGEPWTYEVHFHRGGGRGLMASLQQIFSGIEPRVVVRIPADQKIDLDLTVSQGGGSVRLGGLWLRNANFEANQGGLELRIDEPMIEPMESFGLSASMGGAAIRGIGNASPAKVEASASMGGMDVDLRGNWRNDAEIRVSTSMGGGSVKLPRDVGLEGLGGRNREAEGEAPTLTFVATQSMGEIDFR